MEENWPRIILLLLVVLCYTGTFQAAQSQCAANFPTQEDLVTTSSETQDDTFFLYPSINFTCSVHISGWVFAGRPPTSSSNSRSLEIQTWRLMSLSFGSQYNRISTTEGTTPQDIGGGLYQFMYNAPIEVMAGDVLAIRIPESDSTDVLPLFNQSVTGDEYLIRAFDPTLTFIPIVMDEEDTGNTYFPLVAPIIEEVSSSSTSSVLQSSSSTSTSVFTTTTSTAITTSTVTPITGRTSIPLPSSSSSSATSTSLPMSRPSTTNTPLPSLPSNTPSSMPVMSSTGLLSQSSDQTSTAAGTDPSIIAATTTSSTSISNPISVTSDPPLINAANDGLPVSIIASIIAVVLLIIVIIILVVVLILLMLSNKHKKEKVDIADPPPNGYDNSEERFVNPNYTSNVQLVGVQVKPSNDQYSNGYYDTPEFIEPANVPLSAVYDTPADIVLPIPNNIYDNNSHYEFEPNVSSSSQSHLLPEHYEIPSPTGTSGAQPEPVSHYEMEDNSSKGSGVGGARIYESSLADASSYEQPVLSKNNTMVRECGNLQQQSAAPMNKYHVLDSPLFHDYNVLEGGSILVPNEEERDWMNEDNRGFDDQAYAKLGIIQKQKYENVALFEKSDSYWKPSTQPAVLYNQLSKKKFREILRSHVRIIKHLGSGQFGTVNEGVWSIGKTKVPVAVKLVSPNASVTEKVKLLQEGAIMGQFDDPHVVKLHGVVTVGEPVMIVIELMTQGDLRNRLKQIKQELSQSSPSTDVPSELLRYGREVSQGMEYLSSKSFVHRDLAARNIFLTEDLTCKIGDFGMSRDLDDENYYVSHGGKIPVKWTAPEALQYKKYSASSDVWSFGALMYEIWGVGHKPFEGISNPQTIDLVQSGYRLPPPPGCPRAVYQLMIQCWHPNSNKRPKFSEIVRMLSKNSSESMLSWTNMDRTIHLEASILGAGLEAGQDLYTELQQTYLRSTIRVQ